MARFNAVKEGTKTENLAGGKAYKASNKLALVSLLATSLLTDKAYETSKKVMCKFEGYYKNFSETKEGREFFLKSLIYARENFNMRSVVTLGSALVAEGIVRDEWSDEEKGLLRRFFKRVIKRGDDVTELISAYKSRPGAYRKRDKIYLPCVMKKGLSDAIGSFDSYVLGKYKALNKDISMVDAIRMTHAKHTERNKEGIEKLLKGESLTANTWESNVSAAGSSATAKENAWNNFIGKGEKIEYFALLRNLTNIRECCSKEYLDKALELLTNEKLIAKSKVLPFRFLSAYSTNVGDANSNKLPGARKVQIALSKAIDISLQNVPRFEGKKVCVLLDTSGSMDTVLSSNSKVSVRNVADVFAAALYKANNATVIRYSNTAKKYTGNPLDTTMTIASQIGQHENCGTDLSKALEVFKQDEYDIVILLSDEQSWMGVSDYYWSPVSTPKMWHEYKKKYPNAQLFSFDLAGSGTLEFPENECCCLAGFSDKCLELVWNLSKDKNYLIKEIENLEI